MVGLAWTPDTCVTETLGRTSGIAGFDFEISEMDCDTLAQTVSLSVFAAKSGQTKQVLVFKFGPAYVELLPVIAEIDHHTVRTSIPDISSVYMRRDKLKDLTIKYDIGVID